MTTIARESISVPLAPVRRNGLEIVLLVGALGLLIATMTFTVRVALSHERVHDLTFDATTNELGTWLRANGPDVLGRVVPAHLHVGGAVVVVDTIALVADTLREPSAAAGGFVRDQIAAYNDHAIRRAVLTHSRDWGLGTRDSERSALQAARWSTYAGGGSSLLRTVLTDGGRRRLSDTPDPYTIVIRSPRAEDDWREVRTVDWRESLTLLGAEGGFAITPELPPDSRVRLNGHDCGVHHELAKYLLYCGSTLGAEVGRFYDFGLEQDARYGILNGFTDRIANVRRNGTAESFGRHPLSAGDLLDVRRIGPIMLSQADQGTLAAAQWINGRARFASGDLSATGTEGFFGAAGRSTSDGRSSPLVLSFDGQFSSDLDRTAAAFMKSKGGELLRMSVVVIDIRTGEVRAIAEPGRLSSDEPLLSFEPILVGSATKPIEAAAILSRQPELAKLHLWYAGPEVSNVAGASLQTPFENEANGCDGDLDFDAYIRCSSNQYAAELVVRSLEHDGYAPSKGSLVPRAVLERSALANGLAQAFDVDALAGRTPGRLARYWISDSLPGPVTQNRTLWPWESRPWLLFPDSAGTRVDWLARYAFGGWENRWTLMGLGQAYARIASDRAVQETFLHGSVLGTRGSGLGNVGERTSKFEAEPPNVSSAFARVRHALAEVPVRGTAAGLTAHLQAVADPPLTVLAKTGTLNESDGVAHFKALAIMMGETATGTEEDAGDRATPPLSCGLVVVSYFEFADDWVARRDGEALPAVHVEFASGPLQQVIARHWQRLGACSAAAPIGQRRDSANATSEEHR